ncbi:MAG TPA: RNA methyltransferase [Bacteroidia bacterium]|jgi:TrmH family RNA methyltransferase|nr:RNA methyltransferase [Bacteroidia bacterium]
MISKNQIKQVKALHLKKYRDENGLFIAEGIKIINEIVVTKPKLIDQLFVTESYLQGNSNVLLNTKVEYTTITEDDLKKISMQQQPNNVLAVCNYFKEIKPFTDLNKTFSFYLDDIRDPGNLGTILRMADWFGVKEIFCSKQSTDMYNPKTIQSAMGSFLRVKIHYCDLKDLIGNARLPVYGAVLKGESIYDQKLKNGLVIIGNEANGISKQNLEFVTNPISIPASTSSHTESLNAAMATAIICSEFFRQSLNPKS